MSVIAAYYYNKGNRVQKLALDEHVELDRDRSGFCWIALHDPTPEELRAIQVTYNLHPLTIDNAMHPLCPLEVYNDELYIVAQTAILVGDRICYGKMAIFTGHNHLITVRHGEGGALGSLRGQLEASPPLLGKGSTTFCTRYCTASLTSICQYLRRSRITSLPWRSAR
jgi:magnesium transporter